MNHPTKNEISEEEESKLLDYLSDILEKSDWNRCRICKSMVNESDSFYCDFILSCPYGVKNGP
jgi:hypothetical protein